MAAAHRDLASFLTYAKRAGVNPASTVFVGTRYEYTVQSSLRRYGFQLERTGGRSDLGIDLVGHWRIPSSSLDARVFVQCKAGSQKTRPSMLRELEGAFVGAPVGWKGPGVLGFLVTEQTATRGVRDSLRRSQWPMGLMCCSKEGQVSQMVWNQKACEAGLDGLEVGIAHTKGGGTSARLLHRGTPLALVPDEDEGS